MVFKFLQELRKNVTEEEFNNVLKVAEQDIKYNNIGFNKLTNPKDFIEICMSSLIVIQRGA